MSRHTGGHKGYRFSRQTCSSCGREVACSMDPDGKHVWLRPHKVVTGTDAPLCTAHGRRQLRIDPERNGAAT